MFHQASASHRRDLAVLICPPWGWDEITSYRARRAWATHLAGAGIPTLRIDLPGAGDSGGDPGDPDRLGAWRNGVRAAIEWLSRQPGVRRVGVIGLGLGGLLAADALEPSTLVSDLVLWAVPETGRAWLREQRAFAALQATRLAETRTDQAGVSAASSTAPTLEVGGFALSPDTIESLGRLDLAASLERARPDRILLLDRDGLTDTNRLAERLAAPRRTVETGPGSGWSGMVFHPEQYSEPQAVFERVTGWLEGASREAVIDPDAAAAGVAAGDGMELAVGSKRIRERPIEIPRPSGRLFGIVSEPAAGEIADVAVVFLNAGAVRRVGPNRLWVEIARRWAARGVASVRMDLNGLGDAEGDAGQYRDVGRFYTNAFGDDVAAIVDEVVDRGLGSRVILVGLCAGGYWAFHTAVDDDRVIAALILNPRAMIWDDGLLERREARKLGASLTASGWRRMVRGEVPLSRVAAVSRSAAASLRRAVSAAPSRARARIAGGSTPSGDPVEDRLDALGARGTRVLLAFSGAEPVRDELAADGILGRLDRWPSVRLASLPGRDHTLRPLEAQQGAISLLDEELDGILRERGER